MFITWDEYRDEIENLAKEALSDANGDRNAAHELLWERIDGHYWVIYTKYHSGVLHHGADCTDFLDDMGVDLTAAFKEGGMGRVTGILAFCTMMGEAASRLSELAAEGEG